MFVELVAANRLSTIEKGGNVKVIEASNPEWKLWWTKKGDIDAVLVSEPCVTWLINEIGVNVLLGSDEVWDTGDYSTAVIIISTKFDEKQGFSQVVLQT